ncbi:hypothetical protein V6N12_033642 [Hibiscus sabdariffa]|uniref:Uncharacterized protein n=1 Tax=Hibiscus sabdariffa TaxID=183260 RepID=A0ABR2BW64_9ROSI
MISRGRGRVTVCIAREAGAATDVRPSPAVDLSLCVGVGVPSSCFNTVKAASYSVSKRASIETEETLKSVALRRFQEFQSMDVKEIFFKDDTDRTGSIRNKMSMTFIPNLLDAYQDKESTMIPQSLSRSDKPQITF